MLNQKGGDGICCANGQGSYSIYSRGKLLFVGNEFESQKVNQVSVDPNDYLGSNDESTGGSTTTTTLSNKPSPATWNTPTTSSPTTSKPTGPTFSPHPTMKPVLPSAEVNADQDRWYCGSSWEWVISNCDVAIPCPGGDFSGECWLVC